MDAAPGIAPCRTPGLQSADMVASPLRRRFAGPRFRSGVVLYDGEACVGFGDGLYAVPIRMLWDAV